MSTKQKKSDKAVSTGIRYTDAQKKEIVDFVTSYNAKNGRGGQSAAVAKFKVTPLTISGWLKTAGVKSSKKKTPKTTTAKKTTKTKAKPGQRGVRYTDEKKNTVVEFVKSYNQKNGRGGQNQAAKKFSVSVLTVSAWLKAAGVKKPAGRKIATKSAKVIKGKKGSGELAAFKTALLKLISQF